MAHPSSAPALCFGTTTFNPITLDGQVWLRGPQIAGALGYNRDDRLVDVYTRNASEFTDSMTQVVKAPTAGGLQDVRIFSLRGAHLLGMLARTARAAAFRRWVLDVLEHTTSPAAPRAAALPAEPLERADYRTQANALAMRYLQALAAGERPAWPEEQATQVADGLVHAWLLRDARWLMSFDNSTGRLQMQRLEPGQQLVDTRNPEALANLIRHAIPPEHLPALAHAVVEALAVSRGVQP